MPTARNTGRRIRAGTFTSSGITSTYAVENFTVQTDQRQNGVIVVPWLDPYQPDPPEYARIATALDGTARPDGYQKGVLIFDMWTFGMYDYAQTTLWPGGVYSALVSMMLFTAKDVAVFLNATAYLPVITQNQRDMEPIAGGWENVKVRYDFATVTS